MTRASRALGAALALAVGAGHAAAQESAAPAPVQEQPAQTPAQGQPAQAPAQGQPAQVPAQEQPAGAVVATHGAWQVRCAEGQQDVCVMSQTGKDASGGEVLELQLRKLSGAEAPDGTPIPAAVQILTPLGVLLPAGVRIQVDAQEERAAPFQVCLPNGCVVRQPLSAGFLSELKAGVNARVTLLSAAQQEIPIDISLMGFTKAFNSL